MCFCTLLHKSIHGSKSGSNTDGTVTATFWNLFGSMDPKVVPMLMELVMDTFWNLFGSMDPWIHNGYIQNFCHDE